MRQPLHLLKVTLLPLAPFSLFLFAHLSLSRFDLGLFTVDGGHVTSINGSYYLAPCFATLKRILLVKGWHYERCNWQVCVEYFKHLVRFEVIYCKRSGPLPICCV